MGTLGESLATQLESANNALIAAVEAMPDSQWQAACPDDGRSAGVVAHHVASSHQSIAGMVQAIASGQQLPPITMDMIHEGNAQHAKQFAHPDKAETVELLRSGGAAAAAMLRGLSDEQLARTGNVIGNPMSAQQVAEGILIGHPKMHLATVQQAVG